jgi:hypothetical protein
MVVLSFKVYGLPGKIVRLTVMQVKVEVYEPGIWGWFWEEFGGHEVSNLTKPRFAFRV